MWQNNVCNNFCNKQTFEHKCLNLSYNSHLVHKICSIKCKYLLEIILFYILGNGCNEQSNETRTSNAEYEAVWNGIGEDENEGGIK